MMRSADWPVILSTLGAAGLARAALGVHGYPYGDDLAYGPLARRAADPTLYPGDAQLDAFVNHAWLYSWLWRGAEATLGVAPVFMVLTLAITFAAALAVLAIIRAVGARGLLAPLVVALAGVVTARGVGRGEYGGVFTDHFHLQNVAIVFALFAFAAMLRGRAAQSGLLLGLGAVCHPALAVHAAFAVGCGWLMSGWAGLRPLFVTAALTAAIAVPANLSVVLHAAAEPAAEMADVIARGYFFRAAHHYQLEPWPVLVLGLYLLAGWLGARRLGAPGAAGLMLGFTVLAGGILIFYMKDFDHPLRYQSYLIYTLDLTRSTPLVWALGPALAAAGLERAGRAERETQVLLGAPLALILAINYAWGMWAAATLAVAAIAAAPGLSRRIAAPAALAGLAATAATVAATDIPSRPFEQGRGLIAWLRTGVARDAVIVTPPAVAFVREFAQRPVWADFRLISMSQPAQVWLSRRRLEAVTPNFEAAGSAGGWDGARLWSKLYATGNTPARIADHLADKGDYFVTFTAARLADEDIAAAGLERAYADDFFVVFRLAR